VAAWAAETTANLEADLISSVIGQRNLEQDGQARYGVGYMRAGRPAAPPELTACADPEPFQQARILFQQLGLSSWEKRPHIQLVKKTEQLGQKVFSFSCFTFYLYGKKYCGNENPISIFFQFFACSTII
jgi:hypothetical protein